jgi:hypothetical protein
MYTLFTLINNLLVRWLKAVFMFDFFKLSKNSGIPGFRITKTRKSSTPDICDLKEL